MAKRKEKEVVIKKIPKAEGDRRVLVIADTHCGHRAGLTPPDWQFEYHKASKTQRNKFAGLQKEMWDWYAAAVNSLRPVDILIVNGDSIDGKGSLSGGSEQVEMDRIEQVEMATAAIQFVEANRVHMTHGTGYHVGRDEDWESLVANSVGAKIGSHEWLDINGCIFDIKHHVGRSEIPHGRYTALGREALWNELWASQKEQPRSDILIRSHVHYHVCAMDTKRLAMTTPALQGYGTKFGARYCSGRVDVGLVYFDIDPKGDYRWKAKIANLNSLKAHLCKT